MKQLNYLLGLVILIVFVACTTSNHVSSGRFIQKRKYSKGYSMNNLLHWKKSGKENDYTIDKNRSDKLLKSDSISIVQLNYSDTVLLRNDIEKSEIEPIIADRSNDFPHEQSQKRDLIEKQINDIREDVSEFKQLTKKNKLTDSTDGNERKWKLLLSIILSGLAAVFAILIVSEVIIEIGLFGVFAPYLIIICSFLLLRSYIKKRSTPFNGFEIFVLILGILLLVLSLLFMSFIAAGWTLIFIIASAILFLIMAIFLAIALSKSAKKFKSQKSGYGSISSKKTLMILLIATGLLIVITALLVNYSNIFLLNGIFIWVCIFSFFTTLIYLIWFLLQRRKVRHI